MIVLVQADEWEGLYVDGMLRTEGHSIDPAAIVAICGGVSKRLTTQQDKKLCEVGGLPDNLADLGKTLGPG